MKNVSCGNVLSDRTGDSRLFQAIPAMIAYVDREGIYRHVNERYARFHGQTPNDLLGQRFCAVRDGGEHEGLAAALRKALAGELQRLEVAYSGLPEDPYWLRYELTPDPGQEAPVQGVFVLVEDIHEEKKLATLIGRFKNAFDQGMEGLALHDSEGLFTYANDAQAEIYGYTREEVLGQSWKLFYEPDEIEKIEKEHFPVLLRDGRWRGELRGRRKSGELFDVEASLTVLTDDQGQPSGLACNCRDLTERKLAEESLRQLYRIEALGQLTGGVAHDFNNLLAVISGNLDLLRKQLGFGGALDTYIETALHATERGADLTNRLLAFAKEQTLSPQVVDLRSLIDGMSDMLTRSIGGNIHVGFEHEPDLWACTVDPSQLENAILNLVLNSRDAMPQGGMIRIRTHNRSDGSKDFVGVTVSDTGAGMPDKVRERMFDPFFTTKSEGEGCGLGLSMVHGFVSQSGGELEVDSERGRGTSITLLLPRSSQAPRAIQVSVPPKEQPNPGDKILVVDDNPQVLEATRGLLVDLGFDVLTATEPSQAITLARDNRDIALVLSDVILPGATNGPELVDRIQNIVPGVRGLLMSGYAGREADPAFDYLVLPKPFSSRSLLRSVQEALA